MPITVVNRGTRSTSAPGVPASNQALDVICLVVDCQVNTGGTSPSAPGFTLAGIGSSGGATGRSLAYLWKRLSSPDSGTYALTAPTGGTVAAAEAFALRGCIQSGAPCGTPNFGGLATSGSTTPNVSLSGLTLTDFLLWAFATSGTTVTVSSGASGWNEESSTAASVMHELSQTAPGSSVGPLSLTMSGTSNPRIAGLINFIAQPPPSAAFLALL